MIFFTLRLIPYYIYILYFIYSIQLQIQTCNLLWIMPLLTTQWSTDWSTRIPRSNPMIFYFRNTRRENKRNAAMSLWHINTMNSTNQSKVWIILDQSEWTRLTWLMPPVLQASVRHVHLISARLATPASSSDQNWTFTVFTINNNNDVVSNVFMNLEPVVGRLAVDPAEMCLQLDLNHFVQVRLPWEPGLGISHNKNQRLSQTRTETKANPNILLLSTGWSIWSFSTDWRWGGTAQSTNLTWSRSYWSVLQWSLMKYYPIIIIIITRSLVTYLESPSSLTESCTL